MRHSAHHEGRMRRRMPFPLPWEGFGRAMATADRTDVAEVVGVVGADARPNVRASVLALLADRPMHGYEMITELETRTGGVWRPSPGSCVPDVAAPRGRGLIVSEESGGRRRFYADRDRAGRG